jgi:hypothetical protein
MTSNGTSAVNSFHSGSADSNESASISSNSITGRIESTRPLISSHLDSYHSTTGSSDNNYMNYNQQHGQLQSNSNSLSRQRQPISAYDVFDKQLECNDSYMAVYEKSDHRLGQPFINSSGRYASQYGQNMNALNSNSPRVTFQMPPSTTAYYSSEKTMTPSTDGYNSANEQEINEMATEL